MTAKVFVDTSAFYALASETDDEHAAARAIREALKHEAADLLTTNYVFLETVSLLQRRHGMAAARRFGDFVAEEVTLVWLTEPQHRAAWDYWKERGARGLSLVDCSCVVVMRELGVQRVFGFDEQFRTVGLTLLDAPPPADHVAESRAIYRAGRSRK
jgi:predicted nucleic acid-binding protein